MGDTARLVRRTVARRVLDDAEGRRTRDGEGNERCTSP
jgi:hypothetical protein